jgi:signal transduction histidine kinase
MERVLTSGAILADGVGRMLANPLAQPIGASPSRSVLRWPRHEEIVPLAYGMLLVAVLAVARYPAWRIGIVALAAAAQQAKFCTCPRADLKQCVNRDADQFAWFIVALQASTLFTTSLVAAVTGGLRSPLLLTLVTAYCAAVAVVGDRRQTRILLGVTCLVFVGLALLPPAWTGPEPAGPLYAALAVVSVLGVGALLAPVLATIRRKREEFLRARDEMAADALTRAETLEQIGAKLAHELKNPLTGVKALVQLGLRNPAEETSHERLQIVEREVTRMQEILQNHLSFTRPLQAVRPKRVELGALVSDTLVALSGRADAARVRLFAAGDATVEADPRRIKEALLNLVTNAIEATPPGGEVVVDVRCADDETEIVIRDTGRGMPAETLRRIGTPFFTTREEGTGLGVVLARSVVAQHGGSLRYESEPGKGTRVRVALPRAPSREIGDAARAARR